MKKATIIAAALSTLAAGSIAQAQTSGNIGQVETNPSATMGVSITSDPIVTAILSVPGVTINGYAYSATSGTFLVADSTGSMEIYDTAAATYSPTVGDSISITGEYDPFDGIPELEKPTSVTLNSSGNSAPLSLPVATTVSAINVATLPSNLSAQLVELDDATITGQSAGETFGTADISLTVADSTGSESFFYYPHDYSLANQNLYGSTIPTGPVDIEGIAAVFDGAGEFIPLAITPAAAPEPSSMALAALGGGAILLICAPPEISDHFH